MEQIVDVKAILKNRNILSVLAESMYNPTEERLINRADKYIMNPYVRVYAMNVDDLYVGIIVMDISDNNKIEILNIAVSPSHQKSGIGSSLIDYCISTLHPFEMMAETDDDAVGFYRKYGFKIESLGDKYGVGIMRYQCNIKCK